MRNNIKLVMLSLLALLLVAGCGYHPVAVRSPLDDAGGVDVTPFVNKSYRPGIEGVLARDLVDELALRTGGKVLSGDQAQLELAGVVQSYSTVAVSYNSQDTIKEYRTVMTVQAVLTEKQTRKVLWKGDLRQDQTFPVNPNIALQQNAEAVATETICRRLAEQIWQKIGERF
jgi:outer membrane lipopolysaccharide assembly protein LptE/RlpB